MNNIKSFFKFIFSFQFSKFLIIFETVIIAYLSIKGINLAALSIERGYCGSLPWVATMVSLAWGAYGTSAGFYYNKSKAEQLKKIEITGSEYSSDICLINPEEITYVSGTEFDETYIDDCEEEDTSIPTI